MDNYTGIASNTYHFQHYADESYGYYAVMNLEAEPHTFVGRWLEPKWTCLPGTSFCRRHYHGKERIPRPGLHVGGANDTVFANTSLAIAQHMHDST